MFNLPPNFKQLPKDIQAVINTQMNFDLPQGEDEEGLTISSKVKNADGEGSLP